MLSFLKQKRRGSSLFIIFGIISVLFILGVSFVYISSSQIAQIRKIEARMKARYMAESAIERALDKIESEFGNTLVHKEKDKDGQDVYSINTKLFDLIDIKRLEDFNRVLNFEKNELMDGGEAVVLVEIRDVKSNEFSTYIDYQEQIPEELKVFQKPRNATSTLDLEPVGGISGRMRFTAWGKFQDSSFCLETVKNIRVVDITPPAPDHTLFIHGKKPEFLKQGSFQLSNLDLPPVIVKLLYRLSQMVKEQLNIEIPSDREKTMDIISKLNQSFNDKFGNQSMEEALSAIDQLAKVVTDDDISETVDNIILSLSPRNWGRVRTNGKLEVYLPFFAADDIINYFAESGGWRDLPEVGYLFHDNRLHDPYMSVYTHYEGLIYKRYRKIYPAQYGIIEPEEVPPEQYTINTRLEYPQRYPQYLHIENLERLKSNARQIANYVFDQKEGFKGTAKTPLKLEGIWYFRSGVQISGTYTGRGMIVSEKPITIDGDLIKKNPQDSLSLVCLTDEIALIREEMKIQAAIYAHKGLSRRGCNKVFILGNLACEELNRERMPEDVSIRFDYNNKNHMVDNIYGYFSATPVYYRELVRDTRKPFQQGFAAVPRL